MEEINSSNQISWKGKSEEIKETSNELFIIFALALLTAYLVMAATFNSFVHPFIIVLTVPLALFGGLIFILYIFYWWRNYFFNGKWACFFFKEI